MKNQKRTIMGACDYSIATLENIKSALADVGNPNKEINWAIGGIICTLTSSLLHISQKVILDSVASGEADAKEELKQIQNQFNAFINRMIEEND